eukprot:CAMPEP_0119487160 /NCGR_PEP_ID=MMETSP1344-20130328/13329_1 /TAXON_ID=236787 /ORGANISM="Florenciella parvula, Strain CCMP2471" /LENGTH=131 /DNA_ID=CAMNT_0007521989 /DNA_START=57 /DNA_END=449 /DNA_ORIENTATION=-
MSSSHWASGASPDSVVDDSEAPSQWQQLFGKDRRPTAEVEPRRPPPMPTGAGGDSPTAAAPRSPTAFRENRSPNTASDAAPADSVADLRSWIAQVQLTADEAAASKYEAQKQPTFKPAAAREPARRARSGG